MKLKFLFIILLCICKLESECQDCRSVRSMLSLMESGIGDTLVTIWTFDDTGRLLKERHEPQPSQLYPSTSYNYANDSILGIDSVGGKILIVTNKNGFPIQTIIAKPTYSISYYATYSKEGNLQKITVHHEPLVPPSAKTSTLDTIDEVIDRILYRKGNIVSYNITMVTAKHKASVKKYYCTYHHKPYSQAFDPTYKILGLCNQPDGVLGIFNIQAFCINLLKSTIDDKRNTVNTFEYQFDEKGKVIEMTSTYNHRFGKDNKIHTWIDRRKYEYACE